MKKVLSVAVVLVLILSFNLSAFADAIEFTPNLTNLLNESSVLPDASWTETSYNRALATTLLMLDVNNADKSLSISNFKYSNSYVGSDGALLYVAMPYGDDKIVLILYSPLSSSYNVAQFGSYSDSIMGSTIEGVLKSLGVTPYKNSLADILQVISDLSELIS